MTDRNRHSKVFGLVLLMVLIMNLATGCFGNQDQAKIVGKWRSVVDQQVIEFTVEGIYKGVKETNYTYELLKDKQLKIVNPEYKDGSDAIMMTYSLEGDVLKTTYNGSTIEWQRVQK